MLRDIEQTTKLIIDLRTDKRSWGLKNPKRPQRRGVSCLKSTGARMTDDPEIEWHQEQIAKNQAVLEELKAGNAAGGEVFPETQSEIDR